jgi:hypothetical protein
MEPWGPLPRSQDFILCQLNLPHFTRYSFDIQFNIILPTHRPWNLNSVFIQLYLKNQPCCIGREVILYFCVVRVITAPWRTVRNLVHIPRGTSWWWFVADKTINQFRSVVLLVERYVSGSLAYTMLNEQNINKQTARHSTGILYGSSNKLRGELRAAFLTNSYILIQTLTEIMI